jgi:hypothetical protein
VCSGKREAPPDKPGASEAVTVYLFEGGTSANFQAREPSSVATAKTPTTRLNVRTDPSGAGVLLNGQPIGISPGLFFAPSGDCTLNVELEGYKPQSQQVKVLEGQITRVEIQLKRTAR